MRLFILAHGMHNDAILLECIICKVFCHIATFHICLIAVTRLFKRLGTIQGKLNELVCTLLIQELEIKILQIIFNLKSLSKIFCKQKKNDEMQYVKTYIFREYILFHYKYVANHHQQFPFLRGLAKYVKYFIRVHWLPFLCMNF